MADKIEVEVTGKSKYEVAHLMAINILREEKKPLSRNDYLRAVYQAIEVLSRNDNVIGQ